MDVIDEKIIQILQKDGRISMQKLAKELPMSVPATCDRVRRLEDSGVIEPQIGLCAGFRCDPASAPTYLYHQPDLSGC